MTKHELERCIHEYGKDIYSFCRHLARNVQEADDLYQDTFLTAVKLSGKIEYSNNPKSYLLSVALRIWRNKKRKFAWRRRIADIHPMSEYETVENISSVSVSPEEQMLDGETRRIVRDAVCGLPERLKIPVLLFYMEGMSTAQIASLMKIPQGTVLSRLHQARKLLKKELESVFDEREFG